MFELPVFCPADGTTTPKGKGRQLPPMPYTSLLPPSKQHKMEVGLFCVVLPVFSPANWSSTPKGNEHEIPLILDTPSPLPERQPARACRKRVSASPATRPLYMDMEWIMDWSFCKSNDTRPLHTLPFCHWNGSSLFQVKWRECPFVTLF